jgi:hypothetical protein
MVRKFTFQFKLRSNASKNYEFPPHIPNETSLRKEKREKKMGKAKTHFLLCSHKKVKRKIKAIPVTGHEGQ